MVATASDRRAVKAETPAIPPTDSRHDGPTGRGAGRGQGRGRSRRRTAARQQDHHHHRRLERQAQGRRGARQRRRRGRGTKRRVDQAICSKRRARRHPEDRRRRHARRRRSTRIRAPLPADKADAPRIAIVVGGLGISASAPPTRSRKLPAPVTLALRALRRRSRQAGASTRARRATKCCCRSPMEPFDYPDNDPGPQTLLTSLRARAEHRPPALADEPLPGLCRHHQLHGRRVHRLRAGARAGAAAKPPSAA